MIRGSTEFGHEVLAALDATTVRVDLRLGAPWAQQVLAEALVDLLSRLFPRVMVTGCAETAPHPALPSAAREATLRDRLDAVRTHGVAPLEPGEPFVTVVIGAGERGDIYCDGDGWQSYLGPEASRIEAHESTVPIGSVAAACRAAARVFAVVLARFGENLPPLEPVYWSALSYEHADEPLADPGLPTEFVVNTVLAGAGSVGGAAAYTFARVPRLDGAIDVVDPQRLEPRNPDRALLATEELAAARAVKVEVVEAALAHQPLILRRHRDRFEQWVASRPRDEPLPLVLCSFDSVESRRELQDNLPLEVVNAACDQDSIMLSGHRTGIGPCLYCLYVGQVLDSRRNAYRLIVEATGFPEKTVQGLLEQRAPVVRQQLEEIEDHRCFQRGTLTAYEGKTLDELYRDALMYAEREFERDGDVAAVAAPFVTALAGALLAGEALKAGGGESYRQFRLGPWSSSGERYDESLSGSAANGYISRVPRWPDRRCLCQSVRRQRILRELYGLTDDEGAGDGAMN
jgi:hypothetical protein